MSTHIRTLRSTSGDSLQPEIGQFTDAALAELLAQEALCGRFIWCKGLGWLKWTGKVWKASTDETVIEASRRYALKQFRQAVKLYDEGGRIGWNSMLSVRKQSAVLSLCKGILERDAEDFDAHPDLLNTPGGVVNLKTGEVIPHDSALLMTKITRGSYRSGYTHRDWDRALRALPEEIQPWFQVRIGQAITGYPTPDALVLVLQGNGSNGKGAIGSDAIVPALGDYAAPASSKLITGSASDHTTERADLRGLRLVVAEEQTENRALNIAALKQLTDSGRIKARFVHKDNFSFDPSHSLIVTSNPLPVVVETDGGTWRRLARVPFPYTFKESHQALEAEGDRQGDVHLKERIKEGKSGQLDAVLTWAVEGSMRYYQDGFGPQPPRVEEATREWRRHADLILAFWDDMLVPDPDSCIITTEILSAFNEWLTSNGHRAWPKEAFHQRFKSHSETSRHRVEERQPRTLEGLSRPPGEVSYPPSGRPRVYIGVRFRTADDEREETPIKTGVAQVEQPKRKSPIGGALKKFPNRLFQSCQLSHKEGAR